MTFHSGEQNGLEDVTKNTKLEIIWPIENHPRIVTHQNQTKNSMGIDVGPYEMTFHPSTLGSLRWLYSKVHMLLVKEKYKV
jgi:hypothetical protein